MHMMNVIHDTLLPGVESKIDKTTETHAKNIRNDDGVMVPITITQHIYTSDSVAVIYGDTDSCYFATGATNKEKAVSLADDTADKVNASFPEFMRASFNCQPSYDGLIKAGREVVAERGLFQAKKKYILKVVDLEGMAVDKLKSQGSEMKKSDTPKVIQDFLKQLLKMILGGSTYPEIEKFVNQKRAAVLGSSGDLFSIGVAKQANNLDAFYAAWQRSGKKSNGPIQMQDGMKNIPGHIRAAFMYNELVNERNIDAKRVRSGDKVKIFYLKSNQYNLKSIAFPADFDSFPPWFLEEFQIDRAATEQKMFDNKLEGIFAPLNWEIPTPQTALIKKGFRF